MAIQSHSQMANFFWSICYLLRGPYKQNKYRKVILPLTVLRRFDCILDPTKEKVLNEKNLLLHVIRIFTNVPLNENVEKYFKRKMLPHIPDAWINHKKNKVGYKIPLNRHFYRCEPPQKLEEIETDIKELELAIVSMLGEITGSIGGLK